MDVVDVSLKRMTVEQKSEPREPISAKIPLAVFLEEEVARRVDVVGGKGASLAELRSIPGIKVPEAFVLTTSLNDKVMFQNPEIKVKIEALDEVSKEWIKAKLTGNSVTINLEQKVARQSEIIRQMIEEVRFEDSIKLGIEAAYARLCREVGEDDVAVAVRSSGISEDGQEHSFAGQNKTLLHQKGEEEVLSAVKECLASQFTERAVSYRNEARLGMMQEVFNESPQGIDSVLEKGRELSHSESKLAVVVQRMVDASAAGVGFSVDSKSGAELIRIDVNYGLGESVVSGSATPDSFVIDPKTGAIIGRNLGGKEIKTSYIKGGTIETEVAKKDRERFALGDERIREIADKIAEIKKKYGREVDTEFAIDARGEIYFLQARPETIASNENGRIVKMRRKVIPQEVAINAEVLFRGGITGGPGVASGVTVLANTMEEARLAIENNANKGKGIILVTERTDPDWVPIMKKVSGIVTRVGGATCHAAIVSRELGVPSIVGSGDTAELTKYEGQEITLDASDGKIYKGSLPLEEVGDDIDLARLLENPTKTPIGLIISNPDMAKRMHALAELGDNFKISLLRIEFLLTDIGVHVNALVDFDKGKLSPELRKRIAEKIAGYESGKAYFISKLAEGIASFAAVFPNSDITVRTTDFKTNEYESLIGGAEYEAEEANPMMGWRGLVRSLSPQNREAFKWELEAIKRAREMGYKNIKIMFPMVRDPKELTGGPELDAKGFKGAYEIMEEVGMKRGKDGLKVGIMIEDPANAIRIRDFIAAGIDFGSFGTNDLTQFTLAADRDNAKIQGIPWYGEANPAVTSLVRTVIRICREEGLETGICGQAPSNNPEFARMLVKEGIGSIGVTPDRFLPTYELVRDAEKNLPESS